MIKKKYLLRLLLLLLILVFPFQLFSQEVYFLTGSNFTKYTFKSSEGAMTTPLQSGTGASYEMGYSSPLQDDKIFYNLSMSLNDYNAVAGSLANSYNWQTKYVGLQNSVSFNFLIANNYHLILKGGVDLATIIYGKQTANGVVYNLMRQDEFSGLLFSPFIGAQTKYQLNDFGFLSIGYSYSKSLNPFNVSPDKLSFNTSQLQFGIHININYN
jgi:hypothetical protein